MPLFAVFSGLIHRHKRNHFSGNQCQQIAVSGLGHVEPSYAKQVA